MMRFLPVRRGAALAALALFSSLLSCGREVTGPGGRGPTAALAIVPDFSALVDTVDGVAHSVANLVPFTRVRVELRRLDNSIAAAEVRDFPSDATEISLSLTVRLSETASDEGEPMTAFLRYINAAGDTVFAGGPLPVTARPARTGSEPQPVQIPVLPTIPGATFARIDIAPDTVVATSGQTANFTATGYDAQDAVVPNAIIGFISRNPALVTVPALGSGTVNLVGPRGSTWLVAQSLTGVRDSAYIEVLPRPTQLVRVSGDLQTALTGAPFAQPLRVRAVASDGLGVAGWPVTFAVTAGGGSLSAATVETDGDGFAEVTWTAGTTAGTGTVVATITAGNLTATFTGNQLTSGPASLTFETQPVGIAGGETLPNIAVAVRNGLGAIITDFTGEIALTKIGGGAGSRVIGDTAVNAIAGVATFTELTVDRAGADNRLVARLAGVPDALSSTFAVTPAPPAAIVLVSGGGQTGEASTALPAPIVVRVLDGFGAPVAGATVGFAPLSGGGAAAPASAITTAAGEASTSWTLGASGTQVLRVTSGQVLPLDVPAALAGPGGPPVLFAGFDSTLIRIGQTRSIPLYLSNRADTAISVTLTADPAALQWATGTVQFPAQTQTVNVDLSVLPSAVPGTYWAYLASDAGTDSIQVTVDAAFLQFADPFYPYVASGDTIYTQVRLSEPAPAGGRTIRVRTSDNTMALVGRGNGAGAPVPGCLDPTFCNFVIGVDGAFGDSVDVFVPAGDFVAQVAVFINADPEFASSTVALQASAPGFSDASKTYFFSDAPAILLGQQFGGSALPIGVGQATRVTLYSVVGESSRDRLFTVRSLSPALLSIDTLAMVPRLEVYSNDLTMRGLAAGTAAIEYGNARVGFDTAFVTVEPSRLRIPNPVLNGTIYSEGQLRLQINGQSGALGRAAEDLTVTLTSRGPAIAVPAMTQTTLGVNDDEIVVPVRLLGGGATYIVAEAPGVEPDSFLVNVNAAPPITNFQSARTVGVGQLQTWRLVLTGRFGDVTEAVRLEATARNPAITRVLTPYVDLTRQNFGETGIAVAGVSPGVDTVDIRVNGELLGSFDLTVTPPRILLITPPQAIDPDTGFRWTIPAYTTDTLDRIWPTVDTLRAVVRVGDPAILEVTDSIVTFMPGQQPGSAFAQYRALQPGTTTLSINAPGYPSQEVSVTVRPARILDVFGGAGSVGVGGGLFMSLFRNSSPDEALPLTVTHQGTGTVVFDPPLTQFAAGETNYFGNVYGVTAGYDTVIVSAPNHAPDTLQYFVSPLGVSMIFNANVAAGQVGEISARLNAFESTFQISQTERRFLLRSLDSTRARVERDTVVIPAGSTTPSVPGLVRYLEPGLVNLALIDLDGAVRGDTNDVQIAPRQLFGFTDYYQNYQTLGMNQRTYPEEAYVELAYATDRDLWVTFTASRPGLVTLPDSVRIPAGASVAYFDIAAGDTVGGTRVTASAPGYTPWEFDVVVTNTQLQAYAFEAFEGATTPLVVYAIDALELTDRPLAASFPLRVRSLTPATVTIAGTGEFTFSADSSDSFPRVLQGVQSGEGAVIVEDARPDAFNLLLPGYATFPVRRPMLRPFTARLLTTPGLRTRSYEHNVDADMIRDSVWVQLQTRQGRATTAEDSILISYSTIIGGNDGRAGLQSATAFGLQGVTAGLDTLVFSAAGFANAQAIVSVEPGLLVAAAGGVQTIALGDSAFLTVNLLGPDGSPAVSTAPQSLTVTTDTTLVVVDGIGSNLGSLPFFDIPAGSTSFSVWVRGNALGTSALTITGPNFRPFRLSYTVRSPLSLP